MLVEEIGWISRISEVGEIPIDTAYLVAEITLINLGLDKLISTSFLLRKTKFVLKSQRMMPSCAPFERKLRHFEFCYA